MSNPYLDSLQSRALTPGDDAPANPYLQRLEEEAANRKARLAAQLSQAVKVNPEQYNTQRRVAQYLGYPVAAVETLPELADQAKVQQIQKDTASSPVLQRKYADADFAKLAHDDSGTLAGIWATLKRGGMVGTWWRFATGTLTPQQPEEIEEPGFRAWNGPKATPLSIVTGLANAIPEASQAIRQGLRMQMGDALEALGLIKRDPVYLADQQRKLEQSQTSFTRPDIESPTGAAIYSGAESFLRAIPGLAASVATRSPTPMLVSAGVQTQAEAYGKYRARGGTPGESFAGATGETIVELATEYIPGKYLAESLGKAGAKEFILNFIKKDALGEQAATILQDAIDTAIANPNKTWEEYLAERPMAAYQTLVATLTQAGLMSGVNTAMRRLSQLGDQTSEAEIQADRLRQALQTAGQSLLRERSPEQFRAVMAEMTDGNVYVDGQVLNQLAPEVLNQLPESVRQQIPTAAAIGDSVEIPVADVLTIAPGTPLEQVFVENARTAPDAPSLAEARAAGEKAQEFLQKEAERVMQQAQDQEALRTSREAVKQTILTQLNAAGRFRAGVNDIKAGLAADYFTVMGSRMGMTPEQFYQRYPLRVLGAPVGQQTGVLNAPGAATLRTVNVGDTVDGRVVRDGVPNLESIGSSLDNYKVLPGVREVPMSAFDPEYVGGISMDRLDERTRKLAEDIRASGEITPLIVVQDAEGMYVLEGGHRFDALIASGAQSLPAVVVIDQGNPPGQAYEQSATLRRGTETLKKYGLKPGGKYKTREVAAALEARQRAKYGTIAADDRSAGALANIAKWMVAEVEFEMSNPEKSGVGWYSERFQRALDEMGSVFPELKTDKTARNVMTALIAITSDGQKVVPNFAMAMDIYGNYRPGGATAGRFTTTRGHARQASINGNLEVIQRLHDTMGADGMHQYLMQEKTISELKKLAKENGGELKSDYQAHIKMPMAAVEFGPKLGAFYANLMGAHGYLTMDRWWSRTFNRYRGTLLQSNTRSSLDTFKSLIGKPELSNDEVLAAVVAPREALEARGFKTRLALLVGKSEPSKAKDKAAWMAKARELAGDQFDAMLSEHNIERAANTIYKIAFENLEDAPFNATDRTFMLDAVNKAQQTLKRKGYNLSVADIQAILWYYEKRLYGELGARQTADISYEEAAQRVASSYASGQGIESLLDDAAAAREDGGTDEDGVPVGEDDFAEGTYGVLNQSAVLEQRQAEARDLVLTHNLSAENLLHAQRMGGIPVPSLAVTKSDSPVEGFGDITLIGGPEMADPKGYAGTKVFGADIYSPRYPSVEFKLGNTEMKSLNAALAPFRQESDRELYGSEIRRPDDITSYGPFKRWAADRYGSDVETLSWSQLSSSVNALMREVGAKERIFQGFTYSGNRRYIDHTLDNVVKILKKELRGGENFNYGVGSLRAKFTPQFKSVTQIRKEKSRLVDKETFGNIKKEIDDEFVGIATTLGLSLDQTVEVFEDAPKMGAKRAIERALRDYRQEEGDVDVEKVKLVGDFLVKMRNLPTQYFEAKILRAVDVAEFKAAVVPADVSPEVLKALEDRGVTRVATYDPNNKGDRAAKIQEFSDLFFQGATSPRGTFNPQTLELILNPNADLTTFIHELGHFFLEVQADIASQPNAPAQIVEDMNRVLAWFGIKGDETVGGADSGVPLEQGGKMRVIYRGTNESGEKIKGGIAEGALFAAADEATAKSYAGGDGRVERIAIRPGAKILVEGSAEYAKLTGRRKGKLINTMRKGENLLTASNEVAEQALAAGYDAIEFTSMKDMGIAIFNEAMFVRNYEETLAQGDQPTAPSAQPLPQRRTPLEVWNAMTLDQKRPYHERLAESFEQYMMEGKAPSVDLQPVFRRIRAWFVQAYKTIKQFLAARGVPVGQGGETLGQAAAPEGALTDADGKPLVLYHGTAASIKKFDPARAGRNYPSSGARKGIFFTTSPVTAEVYAEAAAAPWRTFGGAPNTVPAYLTMKNPLVITTKKSPDKFFDSNQDSIYARVEKKGADGVIIKGGAEFGRDLYVVFDPKLIVSAISGEVLGQDPAAQPGPPMVLNDDIRRVFDRMLATDEQIAQANEVAGLMPDEQADGEAAERLQKRSMADLKWAVKARDAAIAKFKREAKVIEKQVREEVTAEVDATPEMRAKKALDALQITPEYEGLVRQHAEERAAVERTERDRLVAELYAANPDVTGLKRGQLLAKNKREIANKVDAYMIAWDKSNPKPSRPMNINDADLATVADSFGFESVPAMLEAISVFGSRQEAIDGMTERRMLEEHGDLIDERAITEAANEAVHNEARARSLATELRTQREMLGARTDTGEVNARGARITVNALVEAAKQFGANVISRTPLKDLKATAWKHTAAERRAGKRWAEATAAGKTEDAVKAKQDQMLNNAAAKAALDAAAEAKKILDFFKRVTKGNDEKTVEKGRDPDIVNAARAVLAAYGIETPTTKGAQDYLDVLQRNDPDTYAVVQPMMAIAMQNAQPLEALTFEELQGLHESIQAMWHLAKRSRQMEVDGDMLDIDDVADELFARMEQIGIPDRVAGEGMAVTKEEERGLFLKQGIAFLRRVEQWAEGMDGKYGGPFLRFIFQPIKDAADRYRKDRIAYRKKFQALVDNLAPIVGDSVIAAPELNYTFGTPGSTAGTAMNEILHAIAHTGNDSNKRKLLLGRGWATENPDGTIDTRRWDQFIRRLVNEGKLQKEHFDFVQGVWDLLEETKPLAQKAHRDAFGRYFSEVTANEFVDPFGVTRRGGYVPAQVDSRLVKDNALRKLAEEQNNSMAYAFPQPAKGFTMARTEYNRPLMLDLRSLSQHLDKVLLFSHMTVPARDVRKLITRKNVSQPLDRIQPAAVESMLQPWLQRSAQQVVEDPIVGSGKWARVPGIIRARAGAALMFANVSNAIQQVTGLSTAMVKVGPGHMMRALAQHVAHPVEAARAVWALSPYMDDRAKNEVAVMNEQMQSILIKPSVYEKVQDWSMRHAYFLQTAIDNALSPIIWTGAYNQALAEGMSDVDAVRFADGTVRQTQGSTLPEDVSRFETGPAYARAFTQFVGYFNMVANTNATALKQIAGEVGLKKGAGRAFSVVMLGLLVPIWVAEAIALAFKGGPDDEDKDGVLIDDWLASVFGFGTAKGLLAMIPILGQAANSAVTRLDNNPMNDRISLSPGVSLLESALGGNVQTVHELLSEDKEVNARRAVRDAATLVSVFTGVPVYAVARPAGYAAGVAQGKIEPTSEVDMARGLITGTASPESKVR